MRSTLIRVEHEKRLLLAAAIGLGAILLGNALVPKDEPLPPTRAAASGSASRAAFGSAATRAEGAAPPASGAHTDVGLDAQPALDRADRYEDSGDYLGCVRELAPLGWGWPRLSEEMDEAVGLKKDDCTRRARLQADNAVRVKDYPAAIALLEPLVEYLSFGNHGTVTLEGGWLLSDLSFAYERNRQYADCIQLIASLSLWDPEGGADKLFKAVEHNRARCRKGLDAKYAIRSGGCRISIDGAIATAAAPPALVPKGAAAACVVLAPGKRPPNVTEDDPVVVCPVVALVWKGANGAVERKELPSEGYDVLDNNLICRGLSSIAVGTDTGKGLVRVGGHCSSKNLSALDVFYAWNGEALTPVLDLTY